VSNIRLRGLVAAATLRGQTAADSGTIPIWDIRAGLREPLPLNLLKKVIEELEKYNLLYSDEAVIAFAVTAQKINNVVEFINVYGDPPNNLLINLYFIFKGIAERADQEHLKAEESGIWHQSGILGATSRQIGHEFVGQSLSAAAFLDLTVER
jgi:hypothetical protein